MVRIKNQDISLVKTYGDLCLKSGNNFAGGLESSDNLAKQA